ncbi:MAG: urease accessory protein UreD [Sarcina sp.]
MFKKVNEEEYAANSELVIGKKGEKYATEVAYFTGIAKLARALYLDTDGVPCYYLMQLGGGYVEKEKFRTAVGVKDNARAVVTTQAATKVYKCENGHPSYQENEVYVGENASLEYITDNVILFRDAMFKQETTIKLQKTSSLVYTEGLTSGWSPDGKRFQYKAIQMRLKMFIGDKPVMLDNLKLNPREDDMSSIGFLEQYNNYSSMIMVDEMVNDKFIEVLREKIKDLNLDIRAGITKLECNGLVLRLMGNLTQDLEKAIFACVNHLRKEKFGANELELGKR